MKHLSFFLLLFIFITNHTFSQSKKALSVKEFKLRNGLTVWINEDHSQPKISGSVVVNAGSKNSPNTGIAHYFEHIMFKGTDKIGTLDYAAEKVYLDSIAAKYEELALEKDEVKRKNIQSEINRLTVKSADYVIPNEFDRLITRYGGSDLNAFTSYDMTVYYNIFSPQYIRQWAEINSERLLNPVFRLFQSELETVYEEKNMYSDQMGSIAVEKAFERFFSPHPYAYSIIGSTESLKNPRLSEMEKFFKDYYVADNMCLILSGDINAEKALPILEETFGRVRSGKAPAFDAPAPAAFNGVEESIIKLPIPIVKGRLLAWRGVPNYDADDVALKIVAGLLNNSNGTGYLDKLSADNKILAGGLINSGLNDAGFIGAIIVPKIPFQSLSKAQKLVVEQIERIKEGDFTDEILNDVKLDLKRDFEMNLEDADQRSQIMFSLFTSGKTWNEYMQTIEELDKLTRNDVVRVANKYLTNDYLQFTKKNGNYPKKRLQKPGFDPIIPKNTEAQSVYAKELEKIPVPAPKLRFIDFDKDAKLHQLTPKVSLYCTENPINEIFTLTFNFGKGTLESKYANIVSSYLNYLGTDSLTFEQFRNKLQHLGSSLYFTSDDNSFSMEVTGYDSNLEQTLKHVGHFFTRVKGDKKKLKQVVDGEKIAYETLTKSPLNLATMLTEKVIYGEKSRYLNRFSMSEIKKLKSEELIKEFKDLSSVECDIHYCGTLDDKKVASVIEKNIALDKITVSSNAPYFRSTLAVNENTIYFIDEPSATQTVLFSYIPGGVNTDDKSRSVAVLYNNYFGSGMASILFQEVREFRSMAYRVGANYRISPNKHRNEKGYLFAQLTTQSDKTMEAISLLDSLIQNMPVKPERIEGARQDVINSANNDFPVFRAVSQKIASLKRSGHDKDPNIQLVDFISDAKMDDVNKFYEQNIKGKPVAYIIVGSSKIIDLENLKRFGKIKTVKKKDIVR